MPFIGDFAWFYISARDMLLTGEIPLVGITSSHTWVHQGPLWTYLLAIPLFISNFNPVSGAYFTAALGTLTVFMIYKIGIQMFSKFVGIVASVLYATSPLVIIHSRMPYHTSIVPLASLLFIYFLYKWIKGDVRFLPFVFLSLGVLYNLELSTLVFWFLLILIFAYGFIKRKLWFTQSLKPNVILLSVFLLLSVMLPMIIYDVRQHSGYFQITAFFRLIKIYLFSSLPVFSFEEIRGVFASLFSYNQRLVFLGNGIFALLLTMVSFFYLVSSVYNPHPNPLPKGEGKGEGDHVRIFAKRARMIRSLLLLWVVLPLLGIILSRTASEAYVPMLFPAIILSIALFFNYIYKRHALIVFIAILLFVVANSYLLISENYLMEKPHGYGTPFSKILKVSEKIVIESDGKEYNLIAGSKGMQLENFEYLTWWLGHGPSKDDQPLKVLLIPDKDSIHVEEKVYNKN